MDTYIKGIQPRLDILKARHFDWSWNYVRLEDALLILRHHFQSAYYTIDREIIARCIALLNQADPDRWKTFFLRVRICALFLVLKSESDITVPFRNDQLGV
jgi:hypothetical protein